MAKIQLAMIGCGGNSSGHARRMNANPDVQIVGTCDVNTDIANGYIDRNLSDLSPRPGAYDNISKLLAETSPDAVVISTPHTLHFEQGMQALEAGCHVLMEKPMVTASKDAYTLAEKVKETELTLTIGYNTPCTPNFYYTREIVRSGEFGKLELVIGYITQGWKGGTTGTWRQNPKLSGGGQAYDSGAHLLNSLCWAVESKVAEVYAYTDNQDRDVDINSSINVKFENGVLAAMAVSGNCPSPGGTHMALVFENGRIEVDGWGGGWIRVWKGGEALDPPPITDNMSAGSPDDNFIDAILGRAESRTSPMNGIIQSELMDLIYESAETGVPARPER